MPRAVSPFWMTLLPILCWACGESAAPPVVKLEVSPHRLTIAQGESAQVVVRVLRDNVQDAGAVIVLRTVDPAIATVSANGWVTAIGKPGFTEIDVRAGGLRTGVAVEVRQIPARVDLSSREVTIPQKGTATITARLLDRAGVPMAGVAAFRSSDSSIVRVSASGVLSSPGRVGEAWVVISIGDQRDSARVSVSQVATRLVGSRAPLRLTPGRSARVVVLDAVDSLMPSVSITMTTDAPQLLSLGPNGTFTARSAIGTGRLTVRTSALSTELPYEVAPATSPTGLDTTTVQVDGGHDSWSVAISSQDVAYVSVRLAGANALYRLDLASGRFVKPVAGVGAFGVELIRFSPDGNRAYIQGSDLAPGQLEIIDVGRDSVISFVPLPANAYLMDGMVSADGRWFYATTGEGALLEIDLQSHQVTRTLQNVGTWVRQLPSGNALLVGSFSLGVAEVDVQGFTVRRRGSAPGGGLCYGMSVTRDGRYAYFPCSAGLIEMRLLDFRVGSVFVPDCTPVSMLMSPDDADLWITCREGLTVFSRETMSRRHSFNLPWSVWGLALSPDGWYGVLGTGDGAMIIR